MTHLDSLTPQLAALPSDAVRAPHMPVAAALQEAHDLYELSRREPVRGALVAVGIPEGFVADLAARIGAAREAQALWTNTRDQTKSSDLVDLEAEAGALRSGIIAAARWNLRGDREADATLSAIRGGDSVADLVQDLFDLATLVEQHAEAFARDASFDAAAQAAAARSVADKLAKGVSEERLDPQPVGTRDLRDRAYTWLDDLVTDLRAAGRYAFRSEPDLSKRFASRYRRRQRRASKSGEPTQTDVVEEEVTGEPTVAA